MNGLVFTAATPAVSSVSIGGTHQLTLNAAGMVMNPGTGPATISTTGGIVLSASQAWQNDSSSNLTVSSPVSGIGALVVNGTGTGKVIISGNNTYTGGTTVGGSSGTPTLQLGSSTALGAATNTLTLNTNGVVDVAGNSVTVGSLVGTLGTLTNTQATPATFSITQGPGTATYAGSINDGAGTLELVKNGAGTTVLALATASAANTYSGGTTVNLGTLRVGAGVAGTENAGALGSGLVTLNGGTLQFNAGNTSVYNIANSFAFNGGSLLNTSGAQHIGTGTGATINVGASGGTVTAAGTLVAGATNTNDVYLHGQLTGSGALSVAAGVSRVHLENGTNTYSGTLTNAGLLDIDSSTALQNAALVNNSTGLRFGSSTTNSEVVSNVTTATVGSLAGNGAFALVNTATTAAGVVLTLGGNNTSTTYTGVISGNVATNGIIKTGTGIFSMNAANTFTGGVVVSQGTVATNNAAGFGTGILTLGNSDSFSGNKSVAAQITAAVTVANAIVVTNAATAGTGTATLSAAVAGTATFSGDVTLGKDLTVTETAGTTMVLSGNIDGAGAGLKTVTVTGSGTTSITAGGITDGTGGGSVALTINGASGAVTSMGTSAVNTYTGATTITSGTLSAAAANAFSANSAVILANTNAAAMNLAGFNNTIGSLAGGGASGGNVALGAGTLTTGGDNSSTSYAGVISGTGALTKTGSGGMSLAGANTYSGPTTISTGSLQLGTGGTTGSLNTSSTISVNTGATFVVNQSDTVAQGTDFSGAAITGGGGLTQAGSGTTILNGVNTYTGPTSVTAGTLEVRGSLTSAVTVTGGTLSGSGSMGGTIIGSGTFLTPGEGTPASTNATLSFTSATLNSGSSTTLTITSALKPSGGDSATIQSLLAAGTYTGIEAAIGSGNLNSYATGLGSGANHDRLAISGLLSINGGTTINVTNNGYFSNTPAAGDIFNLLDWGTLTTGTFNVGTNFRSSGNGGGDLYLPDLSSLNLGWDISAFTTHGILVVVPEPSRALLLLLGLLGLCIRRRRRSL